VLGSSGRFVGGAGQIVAAPTQALLASLEGALLTGEPQVGKGEQSNTSVMYGDKYVLKIYRRIEAGTNPELEFGRFLAARYPHAPEVVSALEYRRRGHDSITLGVLQRFVSNQGNAWDFTIDALSSFFERALSNGGEMPGAREHILDMTSQQLPDLAAELLGPYVEHTRLLGQRTAELHLALASEPEDLAFAPEPFTEFYRRALYHGLVGQTERSFRLLRQKRKELKADDAELASMVLAVEGEMIARFQPIHDRHLSAMRIRCHGDFHLGQVLWTGKDFVIIDFEGEPARALSERRIKRSPLRDVAGMLRSFSYAAQAVLYGHVPGVVTRPDAVQAWLPYWQAWVSRTFLKAYLDTAGTAPFLPTSPDELRIMLDAYVLEKATYELSYELNNRPAWVRIPLLGILQQLDPGAQHVQPAPMSLPRP
jgi:maltose alpha-D-glucosyltransferase / alpha-amylase